MNTKTKIFIFISFVLALVAGFNLSGVPAAQASTSEGMVLAALQPRPTAPIQMYVRGYVYPIAELNNCSSKQACFEFCEQLSNMSLCALFAQKQGLMKPEMVAVTQRLAVGLLSDENFSTCNNASSCVKLCDDQNNFTSCANLANRYQLSSRVLGVSTEGNTLSSSEVAEPSKDYTVVNPYSSLNQNYSNPALNNYLASATNSGCPPLDMLCLSQQSVNPRVLARNIQNLDDTGNWDDDNGGNGVNNTPATIADAVDCFNNASGGLGTRDPATILPEEQDAAAAQIRNCGQDFGDSAVADAESQKQATIGSIVDFQDCISRSTNFAVDIKRCINQELQ